MKRWYLVLSIILIVSGGLVFYTNYDRETIIVSAEMDEKVLLDYHAPETDPLAHHIVVDVDTSAVVEISETLDNQTNIIYTDNESGRFTVASGETIVVVLRNPNGATGTVKTTFYCDSWNYAAYTLATLGTILFVLWYLGSKDESIEEL